MGENGLRPIIYASRTLLPNEKKFCCTELECLSVVWATQKFLPYIEFSHFTVETDHKALQSILIGSERTMWTSEKMGYAFI